MCHTVQMVGIELHSYCNKLSLRQTSIPWGFCVYSTHSLILLLGNTHGHNVPHADEKLCQSVVLTKSWSYLHVLFSAYLVHRLSVSEVNHFVAGTQVFSFDCCTVIFYHLNVVWTSGHILWPGIVVSPPSYHELKRAKRVCKLYVNSYTLVVNPLRTDIHTYKHAYKRNLRLRPHKRPPRLHNYVPHLRHSTTSYSYYTSKSSQTMAMITLNIRP